MKLLIDVPDSDTSERQNTSPSTALTFRTSSITASRTSSTPRPEDLPFNHASLLANSLCLDFFNLVGWRSDSLYPWLEDAQNLCTVNPSPLIAAHARFFGNIKNDVSLVQLGDECYHRSIRFVQKYSTDAHIRRFLHPLMSSIVNLQVYEVGAVTLHGVK